MASLLYDSFLDDLSKGNVLETDTYYGMLVTSTYTPDRSAHNRRDDVTNEVAGTGYTAGGAASAVTYALDTVGHKATWSFADINWPTSTITARALVLYKHRGGSASADELVAYVDFGANQSSTGGTFTAHFTSALTMQG